MYLYDYFCLRSPNPTNIHKLFFSFFGIYDIIITIDLNISPKG